MRGAFLAVATRSATLLIGESTTTVSSNGVLAMVATGVKSLNRSNGTLFEMIEGTTVDETVPTTSV